jgi:hypothetical protein
MGAGSLWGTRCRTSRGRAPLTASRLRPEARWRPPGVSQSLKEPMAVVA